MTSSSTRSDMDHDYTIVYTNRRTVGISVERNGSVIVRAPEGTSDEELERLVSSKKRWISEKVNHPQKYKANNHPPGKELVSGESMLYLGRNYRVEISESCSDQIEFDQKFIVPRSVVDRGREEFCNWYRRAAEQKLVPRVLDWARSLGVEPGRVKVADVQYRWGSCTPAGNVSLNWRFDQGPKRCGRLRDRA